MMTLFTVTTEDAEFILGRPLRDGEASSIAKTLEYALGEAAGDAILSHVDEDDES